MLRRALGEGPGDNPYIVTVPGCGYRFVASALSDGPLLASVPPAVERSVRGRRPLAAYLVLAGLGLVLLLGFVLGFGTAELMRSGPAPRPGAIAVLPFLAGDLDHPASAAGIALCDGLISRLAAAGRDVLPTRSVLEFADPRRDTPAETGRQLGVEIVVSGVVREVGGEVQLSLQLVRSSDGLVVWAETVAADGSLAAAEGRLLDRSAARLAAAVPSRRGDR